MSNCNRQNRRNYYRILQVQPDAPAETIKNNYRILLQKLRLHPDLGGSQTNASLVNQAWQTLRDPNRRHIYDKQLLQHYHIQVLSQGNLANTSKKKTQPAHRDHINQRNYYRILNIQSDAPLTIVNSSYLHHLKNPHVAPTLLQEAHEVLSNPKSRHDYDLYLKHHSHNDTLNKIQKKTSGLIKKITDILSADTSQAFSSHPNKTEYQPIITRYCHFCKTPYTRSSFGSSQLKLCIECNSPLTKLPEIDEQQFRLRLSRINWNEELSIYTDWPGESILGFLTDLSPGGVGLTTTHQLQKKQVIKIDGEHFKCTAKVMHCRNIFSGQIIGCNFITILFDRQQGTFISTQA